MQFFKFSGFVLILSLCLPLFAAIESHEFDSPEQAKLFKKMTEELRCLVCQNQNLADSNADLAQDLREKAYELVKQGNSEEEIVKYMVARYGDFVLYRPPVKSSTLFLWVGPILFLMIALFIAFRFTRGHKRGEVTEAVSSEQLEKARELLNQEKEKS